jgi:predicted nuclease of predicted toxin-antitoxin system
VKLLFDNNLSPSLSRSLEQFFPYSVHCTNLQLDSANDLTIWNFAKEKEFTIVTKDSDFNALITIFGFPPKVLWIRRGNCSTKEIEKLLIDNSSLIQSFEKDNNNGLLILL